MRNLSALALAALLLVTGCTPKDGDPGPTGTTGATGAAGGTGPVGQQLKGNVVGFLTVYNELGENTAGAARAGFTVSVEGANPAITAMTDNTGRYELANVPNGTLNLLFQKTGYSSQRRLSLVHAGGAVPTNAGSANVAQLSSSVIPTLSVGSPANGVLPFSFNLVNPKLDAFNGKYGAVRVFFDTQAAVSAATATKSILFPFLDAGVNQASISLASLGYPSGTRVYMVAYGDFPSDGIISYTDLTTGRAVWPGLSPTSSPVVSFVMP